MSAARLAAAFALSLAAQAMGSPARADDARPVILATTTTLQDTGLIDALLPLFTRKTGMKVKPIVLGTGEALALAARGEADVLLVHSPEAEQKFVADGHGTRRRSFAHNDFVIVGPAADPAKVKGVASAVAAVAAVARGRATFVSRGDDSGTHKKEKALWKKAGQEPGKPWYVESGTGQAETLRIASQRRAYALTDRGTFLALRGKIDLVILSEGDPLLLNSYSVVDINPTRHPEINVRGGQVLGDFLVSSEAQQVLVRFGVEKFGQPLFIPDALPGR